MTDFTAVAPPLTRRQAREIERRTGVRPVAVSTPTAPTAIVTPLAGIADSAALAADVRARLEIAAQTSRAQVRRAALAEPTAVTAIATSDELATTAELARGAVAPIPAAFGGPEIVRAASIRAARPVALVRRQRRVRGAGFAIAASAAAIATVGATVPGIGVAPDAAQASLVSADTVAEPAAAAPATDAEAAAAPQSGTEGAVQTVPLVAAPEAAVDRGSYTVTTVSADAMQEAAAPAPAPVVTASYANPYPTGAMNEGYGTRGGAHNGIDMVGGGCGADLIAVAAGTVTYVGFQGGYGNHVEIKLDSGDVVSYSHLQSSSPLSVGQRVSAGDYVGPVGTTGNSTGCHLHFEVKVGGSFVNPVGWLAERGISV